VEGVEEEQGNWGKTEWGGGEGTPAIKMPIEKARHFLLCPMTK